MSIPQEFHFEILPSSMLPIMKIREFSVHPPELSLEVITTSSPAHFDYLESLGAIIVIDRSAPDVAAQILAAADGPVKYVADAIFLQSTQHLGVEILRHKGKGAKYYVLGGNLL
ncbi:hypothetical protein B0H13DRAFT_2359550 [Mycena leptocephala]|nr:hypothetical protein B0H13DRAFT_2359550 [Mycena leptocephala]